MSQAGAPGAKVVRLIVGGKDGKLTTPAGTHVPVRVFERGEGVLMLVLMLDVGAELDADPLEPLLLEYTAARGLVRLRGNAVLEDRDLVRFRAHADPEVLQRREFVRVDTAQPVVLATEDGDVLLDTHAIDVSGGGMLVTGLDRLELDSNVRFSLKLDQGSAPIEGRGRVVRTAGDGRRALVFDEIARSDRQRLIHFVFECQRAALSKTRESPPRRARGRANR